MSTSVAMPDPNDDLNSLDIDQLRERFQTLRALTCEAVAAMAEIVRVIEERGEDAAEVLEAPQAFIDSLRGVAYGQCLPEIWGRFGHSPSKFQKLRSLPIPDQRTIADGKTVDLVVLDDNGKFTKRKADPLMMPREQFNQVFAHGSIRSEAEQILILEQQRTERRRNRPEQVGVLKIDAVRGGAVFTAARGAFIAKADLEAALAALR